MILPIRLGSSLTFTDYQGSLRTGPVVEMDKDEDTVVVLDVATGGKFGIDLWDEATYVVVSL